MAQLTAVFEIIDRMSDKMDEIANRGESAIDSWERMGEAADSAQQVGVSAAAGVASAVRDYGNAVDGAAGTTDYWTEAVGNYDKSAMEAIYSTEDLVEMGLKAAGALEEERSVMELAEMATEDLRSAIDASANTQEEYAAAMSKTADMAEKLTDSDKVLQEAKEALQEATEGAAAAMEELEAAQKAAQDAQENYNTVAESGTATIGELEAAALNAAEAADNLAAANEKAMNATEELSKANEAAAEEAENTGSKGVTAVESVASALAAAGITAAIKEIAENVYDLADAFSEAEKTVVLATGATGDALDSLTDSMMDAYAASKTGSLDDTAAAVGEINTRLGYTGDKLTETTELFLDFADVTGGNVASSVRSVTQLINQWNIAESDMALTMDKLTYAGQASGIGVDTLSSQLTNNKAILDQLGFSLDESIALFMNMELEGTQASAVMMGFRTALSNGAISSLEDLYDILQQAEQGLLSTEEAADIFGSRAGVAIVNAAQSGVFNLEDFVDALENADSTLSTTADAAQTLDEKWEQATNNVSAAFTTVLEPSISEASSTFAGFLNGVGDFLNEHPTVVKAIAAVGAVLGTAAATFAAVSAVVAAHSAIMMVAAAANDAFGLSLSAALGPIALVAAGVAAVVVVASTLIDVFGKVGDETEGLTATTRVQYYELQDLNDEYEKACTEFGETSTEASRLKYQMDDLTASYEANAQTLEEFQTEVDDLCESVYELSDSWEKAQSNTNATEVGTLALIQKYEDLTSQQELTAAESEALEAVTKSLSESYPDLADKIDNATMSTEEYAEALRKACEQEAAEQLQQEAQAAYVEALKKRAELTEELEKAEANLNAELEATGYYWDEATQQYTNGWITSDSVITQWSTDIAEYQAALDDVNAAIAENEAVIAGIEQSWGDLADATEDAEKAAISFEDACTAAFSSVQDDLDTLIADYNEAYESARDSIDGQIGLFDTMATETELSVADMQSAFASQLEYLQTYTENLRLAAEYGIDDGLIASLSDGSEESAGYINAIVANIQSLGEGSEAAQAFVDDFNTSFLEVAQAKDDFATQVAEMETNFDESMTEIETRLAESIEEMNQEADAAEAAEATIEAYTQAIMDGQDSAVAAAEAVATGVSAALFSGASNVWQNIVAGGSTYSVLASGSPTATTAEANANGTTDSADVFIAGEEGPELIVGKQGSTVFPTSETERIINAVSEPQEQYVTVVNNTTTNETVEGAYAGSLPDKLELYLSRLTDKIANLLGGQQEALDVPAHASGTVSSEDSFIAGENGPELVVGHPDSTVFPAEETDRIVDAIATMYREPRENVERLEQTVVNNAGDVLNEYSNAYDNSTGDSIDQRTYESSQAFVDSSDQRSYAYDYSEVVDRSAGDVLNEYSNTYDNSEDISYDYSRAIDQSSGDVVNEYEYRQENSGVVAAGDIDRSENGAIYVPADSGETREDTSAGGSSGDRKITLEIEGKGNIQLQGGKVDEETMLAFLYEYLKPVLSEILKQEVYEEGDYSYDY